MPAACLPTSVLSSRFVRQSANDMQCSCLGEFPKLPEATTKISIKMRALEQKTRDLDVAFKKLKAQGFYSVTSPQELRRVVKHEIGGNVNFEINSQFMRELREDTFSRNKNDDAHEHVE
ncbi:hypothetical protein Tco_0637635 [Tanacetum coccineum]